ncbi:DUF5716 family protein [Lachnobacterium bovis]|uniref:DUF5716 family protein n=1 Tax=Lachnobacterium bovis TaxID=140626 RepID=UPI0006860AFF|nr:DUF5716 family protein [Lachnobacterium bovis]
MEIFNTRKIEDNNILTVENEYYIGIDLNSEYAMVSYYCSDLDTPETVSTTYGSDVYQIPLILAKNRNDTNWLYGEEAIKYIEREEEIFAVKDFFRIENMDKTYECFDEIYEGKDLLQIFLCKIINLPSKIFGLNQKPKVVISMKKIDRDIYENFENIGFKLGYDNNTFKIIDYKESFYYYMINQSIQLFQNNVMLFFASRDTLEVYKLSKSNKTKPIIVDIDYKKVEQFTPGEDKEFCEFLKEQMSGQNVTSVYLVGNGFDGNWLLESIQFLCKGRRVFIGKNLFSKGACYTAMLKCKNSDINYVYFGENDFKFNLSIKVQNRNQMEFLTLISAGENYYEAKSTCEVILSKGNTVDFWKQLPECREAKIEAITLKDLPIREDKATRIKIVATPISNDSVDVYVEDMGFADIYKSSNKSWHYIMKMPA